MKYKSYKNNETSNFREINIGNISSKILYRSNHPISNGKQIKEIILQAKNAKINTILNLCDNIQTLKSKLTYCPWYDNIFKNNNVIALNMKMNFNIIENKFMKKIKDGILFMIENKPPYLIHYEAGTDRTGFFSIILESFMEAKFDDIVKDYMLSFVSNDAYFKNDYHKEIIYIKNLFGIMKGGLIESNEDLKNISVKYLKEKVGINDDELEKLKNKLMNREI